MPYKNDETPIAPTSEVSESTSPAKVIDMSRSNLAEVKKDFTIFKFGDSEIRVIDKNGEPWFVAADICKALELSNPSKSVSALDDDEKDVLNSDPNFKLGSAGSGPQSLNVVSESGMYTLVLRCRDAVNKGSVPHAFRKWVTADVLPAIRKNGCYANPVVVKKNRQSSATQLTPLRQTAERLIATGLGKIYPDIWKLVHQHFDIEHIHQLQPEQVSEAIEYLNVLEGDFIAKGESSKAETFGNPKERYRVRVIIYDNLFGGCVELYGIGDTFKSIASGIATDLGYKPQSFTHVGTNKDKLRRVF